MRAKPRCAGVGTDQTRADPLVFFKVARPATSVSDLNLTVRQRVREHALGARFAREVTMARLIPFYVPQNFKPPKQRWLPLEQRGKIIEFQTAVIKKSA
jgi:hypothetical protein